MPFTFTNHNREYDYDTDDGSDRDCEFVIPEFRIPARVGTRTYR